MRYSSFHGMALAVLSLLAVPLGKGAATAQDGRLVRTIVTNKTPFALAVKVNSGPPVRFAPGQSHSLQHFALNGVEEVQAVIVRREVFDLRTLVDAPVKNPGKVHVSIRPGKKVKGVDSLRVIVEK